MDKHQQECLQLVGDMLGSYGFTPTLVRALRFFLRNPYESLVITDRYGKIEFMDRGSEKYFRLLPGSAKGRHITDFVIDSDIPETLETGYPLIGRVLQLNNVRKISSVYPLTENGEVIGAIGRVLFHSLEEVNRISRKLNKLEMEVKTLRKREHGSQRALYTFGDILGVSSVLRQVVEMAKKISMINTDVLIVGESGTGKELFSQAIHNYVNPERPFVRVNSPAIPFELAESELFGYEKGAFTGANIGGKAGRFELAHTGTIYLDEVVHLPLSIQAKLLRVLQEREIEKLGGTETKKLEFRLIASTNMDLKKSVAEGRFREDLYYRIAKATIHVPPLRERKEDILVYIEYFLKAINQQFGTRFTRFSDEALSALVHYDWPGNVRELINLLEQAVLKKWEGEEIPRDSLPKEIVDSSTRRRLKQFKTGMTEMERDLVVTALNRTDGNKQKAASLLGISRSSLYNKLQKIRRLHPAR